MQTYKLLDCINNGRRDITCSHFHMQSPFKSIGFIITVLFTLICLKPNWSHLNLSTVSRQSNDKEW